MSKITNYILIIASCLFVGCHSHHDEAHEHEHEHEAVLQLTGYSDHWEVYAEADPMIAGKEGCVLAHFTRLEDFKPLTKGPVTLVFTVAGKSVRVTADSLEQPGIIDFDVTAPAVGTGTLTFYVEGDTVIIRDVPVCKDEEAAHETAEAREVKSANGVTFTKEQSWKVDFATDLCRSEPFGQVIKAMAQINSSQGDEQIITAKSSGIVLVSNSNVLVGQAVSSGQALFTVESGELADNNLAVRVQEAASEYSRAKSEYERKKELAKDKIVSESDLNRAKSEFETAEAAYNNYRRNFSNGKTSLRSPMGGFIKQIFVQNGQYVEAGQPVVSVSKNKNLLIQANVQPKYYALLSNIATANFNINGTVYSLEDLQGKVVSYGHSTDASNPQIPVIFQISNTVDLLPGAYVDTYIRTQSETPAVTVPKSALVEEMGSFFVFVQLTPELFEKREVETGVTDGIRTEIRSGLQGGERVVSRGAILVKLAQASGKLDPHAGHHH